MKARTADRLYKFAEAVTFFSHCSVDFANIMEDVGTSKDVEDLENAIQELEKALENLKSSKALLKDALDKEELT